MIINTPDDLGAALYAINLHLLGSAEWRLVRTGQADYHLPAGQFEFTVEFNKLIFSFWDENSSQSWRIIEYEIKGARLRLRATRQLGQVQTSFELQPTDFVIADDTPPSIGRRRREFEKLICALIEANLTGIRIDHAVTRRDEVRQLSGRYTRLMLDWHGRKLAGIAVNLYEAQTTVDAILGAGLIWFDRAGVRLGDRAPTKLLLFVPRERGTLIAERLTALRPNPPVELYEYDAPTRTLAPVRAFDQGDLAESLFRHYEWVEPEEIAPRALTRDVVALAPELIEVQSKPAYDSLSILGLEFARSYGGKRPRLEFGVGDKGERLTAIKWPKLQTLVQTLAQLRSAAATERQQPFYTLQAERWLARLLQREITLLDRELDPRFVYSQIPAYKGDDRSYVDLLAVTRAGQLVVIELKVSEDIELPFQGLDYWLRVDWHLRNGDFTRRGYFPGLKLAQQAPQLYLVAPLFRFHQTFPLLAGKIEPRVPVWRLGLNEHWRAGVQVLRRERVNGPALEVQSERG